MSTEIDWTRLISEHCHTAVSELGDDTHYEDLLDCVIGMMPFDRDIPGGWSGFALYRLHELGVDISEMCEGHETTNGPAGISEYCNGTCQTRRRI